MAGIVALGLNAVIKRMSKRIDMVHNDRPSNTKIATLGWKNILKHFDDERAPGGKWRSRKDVKSTRNRFNGLLKQTGTLRNSIRPIGRMTFAEVFTDDDFAAVHNKGSRSRNIPRRQFMWIDGETLGKMKKVKEIALRDAK
jgi:phage gpG-like protein